MISGDREKSPPLTISIGQLRLGGDSEYDLQPVFVENLVGVPQSIANGVKVADGAVVGECLWVKSVQDDSGSDANSEVWEGRIVGQYVFGR